MRLDVFSASLGDAHVCYALVRLAADASLGGEGGGRSRRPVNLAVVLDRSSSMRGPRMSQAVLALRRLLERLDAKDRLAVVVFDAGVRVLAPPGPVTDAVKERIQAELGRLETGAGTNLAAGWRKGCELLSSGFVRESISRVLLLTDGLPSVGVRDPEKLAAFAEQEAARGVSTTTMGVGEGFDDELLHEIARRGRGGFYYLATPEAIPAAFGRELNGVFAIEATNVELKIVPEASVASCEVLHRLVTRTTSDGLVVEVGEIAASAPRQLLLRFVLGGDPPDPAALLGKLAVTFRDGQGQSGDSRLDRIPPPATATPIQVAEIALEKLRLQSAVAIDEAWARRASGQRDDAIAALRDVRVEIERARAQGLAPADELGALVAELTGTETALASAARELERHRKAARERSHVTMLGHSQARPGGTSGDE